VSLGTRLDFQGWAAGIVVSSHGGRNLDTVASGQPFVHGLAVNGAAGVEAGVGILRREMEMAMMLSGCATLAAVDRGTLAGACQRT
jgi:isopentenyl diphosphate isomerase/L-lactate dehydrogenase-like FMN-dependent dehydrogenase